MEVIELVGGDEMVWAISTFAGISKYARKNRTSVQIHQNILEITVCSAHVRTDLS